MGKLQVGIIGYGDFTKLMCEYLAPYADIIVSSRSHASGGAGFGASFAPLHEVLERQIIIPSFPSQFFEEFFAKHGSVANPNATVVDVCSVKVRPLRTLEKHLPSSAQIIGTHPLFGPASVANNNETLDGLKIVVSRVRANDITYEKIFDLFKNMNLQIIERTPEQHDKEMAYVQGLSHYIGRVMQVMDIPDSEMSTFAYDDLLDMKNVQGSDSWELFESIMRDNPYTEAINNQLKSAIEALDRRIYL